MSKPNSSEVSAQTAGGAAFGLTVTAGLSAILVGLGLARFAFSPLQPALVGAGWFSAHVSALLASANLVGYLAGSMLAAPLSHRFASTHLLRVTMFLVGLSFLAGYFQHYPLTWHFGWRFMSGLGGGMIMVLAGPLVVSQAKPEQRPLISQVVLLGISMGIVMAGALMPILLGNGVPATWLVLGGVALALTACTWFMWPPAQVTVKSREGVQVRSGLFSLQYALMAVGVVPQMVFLVDYIARDLGLGVTAGSGFYLVYGLGAFLGPVLYGTALRRASVRFILRLAIGVQLAAVVLLIMTIKSASPHVLLVASSGLAGLGMPGLVAIFLARSQQIGGGDALKAGVVWGRAITAFSVGQALCGFATAHLIAVYGEQGLGYPVLFICSAVALIMALLVDLRIKA